jgi:hypothetical protein
MGCEVFSSPFLFHDIKEVQVTAALKVLELSRVEHVVHVASEVFHLIHLVLGCMRVVLDHRRKLLLLDFLQLTLEIIKFLL